MIYKIKLGHILQRDQKTVNSISIDTDNIVNTENGIVNITIEQDSKESTICADINDMREFCSVILEAIEFYKPSDNISESRDT